MQINEVIHMGKDSCHFTYKVMSSELGSHSSVRLRSYCKLFYGNSITEPSNCQKTRGLVGRDQRTKQTVARALCLVC